MVYLILLLAYLLGSVPFGLLIGKSAGLDVRKSGSGNIGATNVNRLLGRRLGILTLFADAGKAVVPMALVAMIFSSRPDCQLWIALAGGAAFLGHLYPVYLKFKGGKGVATALGIFLFLDPLAALFAIGAFALVTSVWGYVSLGSLVASALMPLILWLMNSSADFVLLASSVALLIWVKHVENIARLFRGEENSWRKKGD